MCLLSQADSPSCPGNPRVAGSREPASLSPCIFPLGFCRPSALLSQPSPALPPSNSMKYCSPLISPVYFYRLQHPYPLSLVLLCNIITCLRFMVSSSGIYSSLLIPTQSVFPGADTFPRSPLFLAYLWLSPQPYPSPSCLSLVEMRRLFVIILFIRYIHLGTLVFSRIRTG